MLVIFHEVYLIFIIVISMGHENMFEEMSPVLMLLIFGILVFILSAAYLGHGPFAVIVLLLVIPFCAAIFPI